MLCARQSGFVAKAIDYVGQLRGSCPCGIVCYDCNSFIHVDIRRDYTRRAFQHRAHGRFTAGAIHPRHSYRDSRRSRSEGCGRSLRCWYAPSNPRMPSLQSDGCRCCDRKRNSNSNCPRANLHGRDSSGWSHKQYTGYSRICVHRAPGWLSI